MKKIVCIVLCLLLICQLTACGGGDAETLTPPDTMAPVTGTDTESVPETTAVTETAPETEAATTEATETAEEAWQPPIPGIDAENYPWIDGSTANHPLLARIYREICGVDVETSESMVSFDLGSTGSIWGKMLWDSEGNNTPDLWIVYEAPEDVKADYADKFDEFEIEPLGRDGLVFMVNKDNPVDDLTTEQLIGIYTGQITNWSEVGGEDSEIKPFQRNEDSGSHTLFMKLLMSETTPMEPPTELKEGTMGGLIDSVANFDGTGSAIGYSVFFYATLMHSNPALKLISVDGIEPTNDTIEKNEYPLSNDFYVVIRKSEPADSPVRALRDWLLSDTGRQILEEENYVWARSGI